MADKIEIEVNLWGARKADKFRKRFGLDAGATLGGRAKRYLDVHDYLHTLVGAKPEWGGDEERVVSLEDKIYASEVTLPRGLRLVK